MGVTRRIPGIFYSFVNVRDAAGHWRTLPRKMGGYLGVKHHWNRLSDDWALTRVWQVFGLMTIIHIDAGPADDLKHTTPPGWHFRFARIGIERCYRGVLVRFEAAPASYGL